MIVGLLLILLLPVLVAPFETAGWWSSQRARVANRPRLASPKALPGVAAQIVYFTGVAGYSGDFLARRESALLERLGESFPNVTVHSDIFPYSVNNNPLNGERIFRKLWEWLHRWRLKVPNNVFDALIVARNIGQLLVSADPRYGPKYNRGLAEQLEQRLDPDLPTIFLAYSGGAQMAVGSINERAKSSSGPVHLIAYGGVFTDDPGIQKFASVTQIVGRSDRYIVKLGSLLFPGLWRWQFWSAWNRYRRSPQFSVLNSGPHAHVGKRDYFSFKSPSAEDDGPTYAELAYEVLEKRIEGILQNENSADSSFETSETNAQKT